MEPLRAGTSVAVLIPGEYISIHIVSIEWPSTNLKRGICTFRVLIRGQTKYTYMVLQDTGRNQIKETYLGYAEEDGDGGVRLDDS